MNQKSFQACLMASAVLLGATAVHAQSAYYQAVTNLNPVAYWPLQETVAPPVADVETNLGSLGAAANAYYSSVNVNHQVGGVTGDGDGAAGFQSAENGSFLAVPTTNGVTVPVGPFTVEAWVNPATSITGGATIMAQTGPVGLGGLNGGLNSAGWSLNENFIPSTGAASGGCWSFHVYNGVSFGGGAEAVAPMSVNPGTWYHLVGVFDGTSAHLYVDGTNDGSSTPINGAYIQDTWDPLTIGCGRGLNDNRFNGTIDEVAIYPAALTPTQILNHYNAVNGASYASTVLGNNPSMYWRMDAPAYNGPVTAYPAAASSGSSLYSGGLYLSGTTPGLPGPAAAGFGTPSYACGFNGIGTDGANQIGLFTNGVSFVNYPANSGVVITNLDPLLNQNSTNSITVMVWFKGNPADTGSRFQTLLGHGNSSWRMNLDNGASAGGKVTFNPGLGSDLVSSGVYNDGNWHLAVGVYYNSGKAASPVGWLATNYLYVDGVLNGSAEITNNAATTSTTNVLLGGAPDYVASGNGNVYNQRFFGGSLAHAAYFTNALTATQVESLYNSAEAAPAIQTQPVVVVTANGGTTNVFTVTASGAASLTYQWYENTSSNYTSASALTDGPLDSGAGITGSATTALSLTNLQAASAGYYYVVVNNNYGSVTSVISQLIVLTAPVITAQSPTGAFTLYPNQSLPLSVTASGPAPLTYQWLTNGMADTAAGITATYPVTGATAVSGTTYQCVITNTYGSATSVLATLTVQAVPGFLTGSSYSSALLALNPLGYWPMHEIKAPIHGDSETNLGSLGSLANGYYADWTAPGSNILHQIAGALAGDLDTATSFYGVSNSTGTGYMLVPRTVATGLKPPFTVEAWVNPYNTTGGDIVSQSGYGVNANNTGNVYGFRLMWQPYGFEIGTGTGTNASFALMTGYGHNPGQWYHVAATYDGTNATLYVNGQLENTMAVSYALDSSEPLVIGSGLWSSTGPSRGFAGGMDEVAVYTNVLQASDISQHYSDGINPAPATSYYHDVTNDNPTLYYRMDAPAYVSPPVNTWAVMTNYGSLAMNGVYSPACQPGALTGANLGVLPTGLSSTNILPGNGLSTYADAGYNPALNPTGRTPITVSGWFKANPADSRFQILFGNDSTWRCAMDGTVGKVHFNAGAGGEITSAKVYNDGNWHQVVGVYDGSVSSNNFLYVDGVLDTELTVGSGTVAANTADIMMLTDPEYTNSPIGLGRQFAGSVCDVAVWTNTVFSAAQVQALYTSANVPPFVTAQPVTGRTISGGPGSYIYFGVAGDGSPTLNYQWYFNAASNYIGGTALANGAKYTFATTPQVTVTNLGAGDSGYYYVVITNNYGSTTSALASLLVYTNPVFVTQTPLTYTNPFTLFAGATPIFSVVTEGIQPITYQWYTNGISAGAGATGTNYSIAPQPSSFNVYCVAANSSGNTTSAVWNASVIADPTNPYPQAVLAANPVGYWRLNEVPDNGSGNAGAICTDYIGGNNGIYTNVVLGGNLEFGVSSYSATDPNEPAVAFGEYRNNGSTINSYANIQGVDFAAPNGATTNFTVECWTDVYPGLSTGDAILSKGVYSLNDAFVFDINSSTHGFRFYIRTAGGTVVNCTTQKFPDGNWHHLVGVCNESAGLVSFYIDGTLLASTSISTTAGLYEPNYPMSIGSVQSASETATYSLQLQGYVSDVAVYNYALTSSQITSQFSASGSAPFFIQTPVVSTNVDAGGTLVIPTTLGGSTPMTLQWWNDNTSTAVAGQTNATLVYSNITTANTSFYLVAANNYGSIQSAFINVNVIAGAPQLYANMNPPGWAGYVGSQATFSVTAYGTAPIYYQWYENGGTLSGATNATYTTTVALGTNLLYCSISNAFNGGSLTNSSTNAVIGISLPTSNYAKAVLSNNPVAYWPLNETSGDIANDYIGNHDAVYTNVQLGASGFETNQDLAAWFGTLDSIDSYAGEIDNSTNGIANIDFSGASSAEFSVEAWVNGGSSQVDSAGLVAKGYSGDEQFAMDCYGGAFRFFVRDGVNVVHLCTASVGPDGNWHHLVGVCDQENGLVHLYVDGVDNNDSDIQAGKGVLAIGGAALPAGNLVSIGARDSSQSATDFDYQFVGRIQDVAIYNHALSAAQVAADYQAGTVPVVNTTPTNLVVSVSGNQLTLSWPADHTGWQLQAQTNAPGAGLGTNWVNVGGSTGVNELVIQENSTNGSVFYRLVYP